MRIQDNKSHSQYKTDDPKVINAVTNNDEADKVVNTDNASSSFTDRDTEDTLTDTTPSAAVNTDIASATDQQLAGNETATDAEIAGDNDAF